MLSPSRLSHPDKHRLIGRWYWAGRSLISLMSHAGISSTPLKRAHWAKTKNRAGVCMGAIRETGFQRIAASVAIYSALLNLAPEALTAATLLGGTDALRFSGADPVWTPPGTFDARPDLGGLNQVHPDVLARSSERPVGPTTETGVPPSTNEPVPPTVPATTVGPMTADAAKKDCGPVL